MDSSLAGTGPDQHEKMRVTVAAETESEDVMTQRAHPEAVPVWSAPDALRGDAELLASGLLSPLMSFIGTAPVVLDVPPDVGEAACAVGILDVADRQGVVSCRVHVESTALVEGTGKIRLSGPVIPLSAGATELADLAASGRVAGTGRARIAAFVRGPLLTRQIAALAEAAADLDSDVLLIATSVTGEGELPPWSLLHLSEAVARETGWSFVRVPFAARRDAGDDLVLRAHVAKNLGATHLAVVGGPPTTDTLPITVVGLPDAPHETAQLLHSLDTGIAPPADVVPAAELAVLRQWRPPRVRRGLTILFTGLSGSGKSTLAEGLVAYLRDQGSRTVSLLDGDEVRHLLSAGLGFSRHDRDLNVRRIGWVAAEITRHGGIAICAPIAPYADTRADVRRMVSEVGDFVLVHVATPVDVCEARDRKGLYARARAGAIPAFTGVSDPYEAPEDAEITVDTADRTVEACLADIVGYLRRGGWLGPEPG